MRVSDPFHYRRRRRYCARFRSDEATAQASARPFRRETAARLRGAARLPRRGGAGRGRRRHRDPQAPRRVHRGVGRDRAGAEHAAARLAGDERGPRAVPLLSGRDRGSFLVRRGRLRQPVPVVPSRPAAGAAPRRPDRTGAGALRGRSLHGPARRLVRRAVADRARPRRRDLDRPRTRALGGSRARIRLRLREPRRRGRRHHRAPARTDLRARPRPAAHGGEVRGPPPPPPARGTLPLVRGDAGRRPLRPRRLRERELRRGRPLRGEMALRGGGPGASARAPAVGRPRPRGAARPRRSPCATSRAGTTRSSTSSCRT